MTMRHFILTLSLITGSAGFVAGQGPCPQRPGDLVDLAWIHRLTLKDLKWRVLREDTLPGGLRRIVGSWEAGTFLGVTTRGTLKTVTLAEQAALILPKDYPKGAVPGKALVKAAHLARFVTRTTLVPVVRGYGLPVLLHGEDVDWEQELGYPGRGGMVAASMRILMQRNPNQPVDLTTGNYPLILARTQLMAIQLCRRLLEQQGGSLTTVALMGGSKEGYSTWFASAVEPKIQVAYAAGFQYEDYLRSVDLMVVQWNGTGPLHSNKGSVEDHLDFAFWLETTPAGACVRRSMLVQEFKGELKPAFFLIAGDVTLPGLHDANHYPLGCETLFLDGFTSIPWVYDRLPDYFVREPAAVRMARLGLLTADAVVRGPNRVLAEWPRVLSTRATADRRQRTFAVQAQVAPTATAVRLWWSYSTDRRWNEKGQALWQAVPMQRIGTTTWQSPVVRAPRWSTVAWYVEAENTLVAGNYRVPRYDASPVRFLFPLPSLLGSSERLKVGGPGTITFNLDAGPEHAGRVYWLLGSLSGTTPGIQFGRHILPLNPDGYTWFLFQNPNTLIRNSFGTLDASGRATATLKLTDLAPALAGLEVYHAYLIMDTFPGGKVVGTSNAAPLRFVKS